MLCAPAAWADGTLGGYFYQQQAAPTGWEWQSPDSVAVNKLQPHAWFFSFRNIEEARKVLPENSSYWKSLDGMWKFHYPNPDERPKDFFRTDYDVSKWDDIKVLEVSWNMAGLQRDGKNKYGDPLYSNQRVIFQHSWQPMNDWKGGVMRTPPKDWMTYRNRNEVGYIAEPSPCLPTGRDRKSISTSTAWIPSSISTSTASMWASRRTPEIWQNSTLHLI